MQISSVWFWFVVFRNMLSWATGQKVSMPKCFQKCFISFFSIHHSCHHCPVQTSTRPALLAPSSSSHAHKQVGLCSNTGPFPLAFTHFLKWGQLHHSTRHTPMTAPSRAEKWACTTGGLPLCLTVCSLNCKSFSWSSRESERNPKTHFLPILSLTFPTLILLVLSTRKSKQVKDRSNTMFTNFPPWFHTYITPASWVKDISLNSARSVVHPEI